MKIIDTHLHFWDLSNKINNWVLGETNHPELQRNYLPTNLFAHHNLYGVVHVEAHDSAIPTIEEIRWLDPLMKKHTVKYAHIACVDITQPVSEFAKVIQEITKYGCVKGVRHILAHHTRYKYNPCNKDMSEHKNILANLEYLYQNRLIFVCQMYPYQLHKFLPLIIQAKVTCIIDHIALPDWDNAEDKDLWQQIIIKLAAVNHVFIKLSGLNMFKPESEFDSVLDFCLQHIPVKQLIYGSNYPVSCNSNYNSWWDYLNKAISSDSIKEQIFYTNALKLFF